MPKFDWSACIGTGKAAAMSIPAAETSPPAQAPTHADLFLAFLKVAASGFGGALPWARRMFVEERRWMTAAEFNTIYALCQFLPGPNIVNMAAVFGSRVRGPTGAVAAVLGFIGLPFVLMVTLGFVYAQFGDVDVLRRVLGGLAAAAAGMIIATALKMAQPVLLNWRGPGPVIAAAMFVTIGVLRWPMPAVIAVLVPLSVAAAWRWGRG
jgi:chromate transporter